MIESTLNESIDDLEPQRPFQSEWKKKVEEQGQRCDESLDSPRYLLTVYQTGDERMTGGDWERKEPPRRYYVPNASLNDIKNYIEMIDNPHWHHHSLSQETKENDEVLDAIPFEEKKWSIVYDFVIEPMTKELEDAYVDGVKSGFFKKYRQMYGTSKDMLGHEEFKKNFENEDFEKDSFIIEYVEGSKVSEK
tara:strand:- start:333 stop:908 length:576 start_codon:yes stop_codon:yes gene_type:complete